MSEATVQQDPRGHGERLDVQRLIESVRGSRAAQVLFEFRLRASPEVAGYSEAPGQPAQPAGRDQGEERQT